MGTTKGRSPPVLSEKTIREIAKTPTKGTTNVQMKDIAGSIFAVNGGINVIADLLNERISLVKASERLFDLGVYAPKSDPDNPQPVSKQALQYHKNKVKKRLGITKRDKNAYYVPFITSETATNYLKKAQTEINMIDKNHLTNQNFKTDPILGLHMLAMELETLAETVQLDFKETLQLKKLKMLIFEKLNKLDDDAEKDLNKKELVKKLDDLSRFHADYHIFLNDAYEEFANKVKAVFDKESESFPFFSQLITDFKEIINIKDKYTEYIKQIKISGEELETIFEPQDEYFDIFENLDDDDEL